MLQVRVEDVAGGIIRCCLAENVVVWIRKYPNRNGLCSHGAVSRMVGEALSDGDYGYDCIRIPDSASAC
jgi:hypothetical protein